MITIKVCLGSSCYIRGNDKTLAFLEEYIQKSKKNIQIELSGCRCGNLCQDGPNIFINDKKYSHPTQKELIQILEAL
ncbi:MAG: (2Fe-2S) ferredoxin domain-containing protein [Alphaproteobacteria bacterium]|nr:(2Fe-2S) ferredoxin domain-containing protein [Alphaproteobacteria bacterium]